MSARRARTLEAPLKLHLAVVGTLTLITSLAACRYEPPAEGRPNAGPAATGLAPRATAPAMPQLSSQLPPGHPTLDQFGMPATAPPAATAPVSNLLTGRIVETMNAGGYTYMRLRGMGSEFWAAVPHANVVTGDTVTIAAQMTMTGFESKSLNRKFDTIIFAALPASAGASPAPPSMPMPPSAMPLSSTPPVAMPPGHPMPGTAAMTGMGEGASRVEPGEIKVEKAEGADGRTVAEIWASKDTLGERQVAVRGKVVKFLPDIMGKNWIHLRDGSGSRDAGNDDITITTTDKAAAGDVVLITGTVKTGVNLGAGYTYPVLIENARVRK